MAAEHRELAHEPRFAWYATTWFQAYSARTA
jgi:hypothetical protein